MRFNEAALLYQRPLFAQWMSKTDSLARAVEQMHEGQASAVEAVRRLSIELQHLNRQMNRPTSDSAAP